MSEHSRYGPAAAPWTLGSSIGAPCVAQQEGCSRSGCPYGLEQCSSSGQAPDPVVNLISCCRSHLGHPRFYKRSPTLEPEERRESVGQGKQYKMTLGVHFTILWLVLEQVNGPDEQKNENMIPDSPKLSQDLKEMIKNAKFNQPMYKISHLIGQVGPILPSEVTQLWANMERRDCKVNLLHVVGCSVDLWPVQLCSGFGSVH